MTRSAYRSRIDCKCAKLCQKVDCENERVDDPAAWQNKRGTASSKTAYTWRGLFSLKTKRGGGGHSPYEHPVDYVNQGRSGSLPVLCEQWSVPGYDCPEWRRLVHLRAVRTLSPSIQPRFSMHLRKVRRTGAKNAVTCRLSGVGPLDDNAELCAIAGQLQARLQHDGARPWLLIAIHCGSEQV